MSMLVAAIVMLQVGSAMAPAGVATRFDDTQLCVAIAGPALSSGSAVTLIQPDRPQSVMVATISQSVSTCASLVRADVAGPYYVARPASSKSPEVGRIWIVFRGRIATRRIGAESISVALDATHPNAQVRSCASHEGLHLTVWSSVPLKSERLWHEYYYLGFDVEPTCEAADGLADDVQLISRNIEPTCVAAPGRVARAFGGELKVGELYEQAAGPFVLRLQPDDFSLRQRPNDNPNLGPSFGWNIEVRERGRDDDLSQFTLPLRGPNPRHLSPWIDAAGRLMNVPAQHRVFYFSPEVGRTIVWENDSTKRRANIDRVYDYGHGTLDVLEYRLAPPTIEGIVGFEWIRFSACLSWPE